MVMRKLHKGPSRRHFTTKLMQRKILDAKYWWPIMYKYVQDYCKSCDACQIIGRLATQSFTKLITSFVKKPFMKWDLILWGQSSQLKYILEINIFCSHRLCYQVGKARASRTNPIAVTTIFLYECIFTRFGCPLIIFPDQGVHFINDAIKCLIDHFLLKHVNFTTYYPQGNGQVKFTNEAPANSLKDSNVNFKVETMEKKVKVRFVACNILRR